MKKPILSKIVARNINDLCELGDALFDLKKYRKAARKYIEALRLLPRPVEQWEVTPHLCFSWGLAYFKARDWDTAINSFESALEYESHRQDPWIHLNIGIVFYKLKKPRNAKKYLKQAFELGGCEVFHGVDNIFLKIASSDQPKNASTAKKRNA